MAKAKSQKKSEDDAQAAATATSAIRLVEPTRSRLLRAPNSTRDFGRRWTVVRVRQVIVDRSNEREIRADVALKLCSCAELTMAKTVDCISMSLDIFDPRLPIRQEIFGLDKAYELAKHELVHWLDSWPSTLALDRG
jgi:hypothetical protein